MKILVIDGQGGGVGRQIVSAVREAVPEAEITAAGTNTAATSAMLKAGADNAATGENAVIVGCRTADVITGPVGIGIADSMYGEITPKMALAVGQSTALRIFIPINHCNNMVVGVSEHSIPELVAEAAAAIKRAARDK